MNEVVDGDVEHPFESVAIISYVPLHSATKEYVEVPDGKFIAAPELTAVSYTHLTLPTKRIV